MSKPQDRTIAAYLCASIPTALPSSLSYLTHFFDGLGLIVPPGNLRKMSAMWSIGAASMPIGPNVARVSVHPSSKLHMSKISLTFEVWILARTRMTPRRHERLRPRKVLRQTLRVSAVLLRTQRLFEGRQVVALLFFDVLA